MISKILNMMPELEEIETRDTLPNSDGDNERRGRLCGENSSESNESSGGSRSNSKG